jgi:exopolysaccharide production protein ExoQ
MVRVNVASPVRHGDVTIGNAVRSATSVAHRRRQMPGKRGAFDRWALPVGLLLLIVASDYKFRRRAPGAAVSGAVDAAIATEMLLYAVVVGMLAMRRSGPPKLRRLPLPAFSALMYVGFMTATALYAVYPTYAMVRSIQMFILTALILEMAASGDRALFHRFAHLYMTLIMLSVVYGVVRPSPPSSEIQEGRFTWLAIHPTVSGVLTGTAAVIALAYCIWGARPRPGPRWPHAGYLVSLTMLTVAVLSVHTRGAVVGASAGAFVLMLFAVRGKARLAALSVLALIVVMTLAFAWGAVVDYFVRDEPTTQLTNLNSRTDYWAVALDAVAQQPVFGYGVAAARGLFVEQTGLGGGHNAVVNVLVDLGAVGIVLWSSMVLATIVAAVRARRRMPDDALIDRAIVLGIVAFLLLDGIFYEGAGGVANVGATWMFTCIGWATLMSVKPRQVESWVRRRRSTNETQGDRNPAGAAATD